MIGTLITLKRNTSGYFSEPGTENPRTGWLEVGDCIFVIGEKTELWNEFMVLTRLGVLWIPKSTLK